MWTGAKYEKYVITIQGMLLSLGRSSTCWCISYCVMLSIWRYKIVMLYINKYGWSWEAENILMSWIINSLPPVRCGCNFKNIIFKLIVQNDSLGTCYETVLKWMQQNLANEKSTLLQMMAWCHQATSHCMSQCWPRSLSPYGITRPQWVKELAKVHCWLEQLVMVHTIAPVWQTLCRMVLV